MSMVWDAPLVAATAAALAERLRGARLAAVHLEYDALRLRLHFREATVVFLLHPDEVGLRLLEPADPGPDARPLAARLRDVQAPADDRTLTFDLQKVRGTPPTAEVIVELLGNQGNVSVTEGPQRTIRHLLRERTGARTLAVGHPWVPPPAAPREGAQGEVGLARWIEVLDAVAPDRRRGALLSTFAWTSGLNAPALLEGAGPDLEDGFSLWGRVRDVALGRTAVEAVVLDARNGPQPYPLPLPGMAHRPVTDLVEAFAEAAARAGPGPGEVLLPRALLDGLERHLARARARVASLEEERDGLPDPASSRALGDLLLARFGEVPQGASEVTLTGFDGEPVTVALDPTGTPDVNARAYYDRAARAERAAARLPELVTAARERWRALETLLERARAGEVTAERVRAELPDPGRGPAEPGSTLPYRVYRSSGGLEIRVGRGARRNDDLTFHHAAPDDIWLHARHAAGAHVILRWQDDGNPPARDLAEAAVLAALASKARTSGSVPVDWTRRKYVRKPRKAPPGAVVPDRIQTLFVEPDPALEERLRTE
jgi:predicted ribosome quality control (RQC) complex YloA/Tae2 family protein